MPHSVPSAQQEAERLDALRKLELLDTPPSEAFDRITRMAAQLFGLPVAAVSLTDADRQWFKSRVGLALPETPREQSFCSHAILGEQPMLVFDAQQDLRFAGNPLVTGAPHIRFYAGVPLLDAQGYRLGTLCVLDREPRRLRERELRALRELAKIAMEEIRRRRPPAAAS